MLFVLLFFFSTFVAGCFLSVLGRNLPAADRLAGLQGRCLPGPCTSAPAFCWVPGPSCTGSADRGRPSDRGPPCPSGPGPSVSVHVAWDFAHKLLFCKLCADFIIIAHRNVGPGTRSVVTGLMKLDKAQLGQGQGDGLHTRVSRSLTSSVSPPPGVAPCSPR